MFKGASASDAPKRIEKPFADALSSAQCRMARAGLKFSIGEISNMSLVSRGSITRFEQGKDIKPVLRSALRAAFERHGIVFTETGIEILRASTKVPGP